MRTPKESLEDFMTGMVVAREPEPEQQAKALLQPTGEVEILRPLAISEKFVKPPETPAAIMDPIEVPTAQRSLTLRALAFAGGLAVIAFIAISVGLFRGNNVPIDPIGGQNTAGTDQNIENNVSSQSPDTSDALTSSNSLASTDTLTSSSAPAPSEPPRAVRSVVRSQVMRSRFAHAAYFKPRVLRQPQIIVSDFAPTTVVIYADNGVIKTRVEPQLNSGYKKPLSLPN